MSLHESLQASALAVGLIAMYTSIGVAIELAALSGECLPGPLNCTSMHISSQISARVAQFDDQLPQCAKFRDCFAQRQVLQNCALPTHAGPAYLYIASSILVPLELLDLG